MKSKIFTLLIVFVSIVAAKAQTSFAGTYKMQQLGGDYNGWYIGYTNPGINLVDGYNLSAGEEILILTITAVPGGGYTIEHPYGAAIGGQYFKAAGVQLSYSSQTPYTWQIEGTLENCTIKTTDGTKYLNANISPTIKVTSTSRSWRLTPAEPSAISMTTVNMQKMGQTYDLTGRKVAKESKGLLICDGKKQVK